MPDSTILPVRVRLENGRPAIACLDFEDASFAEPFYANTIALLPESAPLIPHCGSPEAALDRSRRPAGFIFHISRCGSTLVSQLLKEVPGVRVYSEPQPINQALRLASKLPRQEVRELLETLIRMFCAPSKRVFFKLTSWNVLEHSLFDELFPDVPKLFVIRRPVEVLASIARLPPAFVIDRDDFADLVRGRAGDRAGSLDDVEFAAVLVGAFLDAMAAAATNGPARVLDYTELPSAAWRTLPSFFGLAEDEIDIERMAVAARFSAKSPDRVPFRREEESAPNVDRQLLERYAAVWTEPRYGDLLASRGR